MELVILPFFIPLILLGRFVDAWREYRGTHMRGYMEVSSEADWEKTWGRMLSGEAVVRAPARRR